MLMINGSVCTDKKAIKDHVITFYNDLFNGQTTRTDTDLPLVNEVISNLISEVDDNYLTCMSSSEDVKLVVFGMNALALGHDDFGSIFYQSCWNTVGQDVIKALRKIFRTEKISKSKFEFYGTYSKSSFGNI